MNINYSAIAGWILLIAGLVIIAWTLVYSCNIFLAKTEVPELFVSQQTSASQGSGLLDIQGQIRNVVSEQLPSALPSDFIARILNLAAWSILAFILVFGGGQISSLGIKLIKK